MHHQTIPVDKGWAWVVLFATFLDLSLCSLSQSAGVFNMFFLQQFDTSHSIIAACGAVQSSLITFTGPVASIFIALFGPRVTITIGGTCTVLGFFLTFFAKSFIHVFITYGFITGFGLGLCYATGLVNLGFYFKQYRNTAYGIALSAMGIGMIAFPPIIDFLFEMYSMQGTMLILAGICGNMFIVAMLTLPINYTDALPVIERKVKKEDPANTWYLTDNRKHSNERLGCSSPYSNEKSCAINNIRSEFQEDNDKQLGDEIKLKEETKQFQKCDKNNNLKVAIYLSSAVHKFGKLLHAEFFLFCFYVLIIHVGLSSVRLHFAAFSYEQGASSEMASVLVTIFGIGNFVSRISVGLITNNRTFLMYVMNILSGILTAIIAFFGPYICASYTGQMIFSFLYSLFGNAFQPITSPITIDIVGLDLFNMANGIVLMMSGVGLLIGPPLTGWIYDIEKSYFYTFTVSGACYTMSTCVIAMVLLIKRRRKREGNNML